jgi:hypothetical protein
MDMSSEITMVRRNALKVFGTGLVTTLLLGTTAQTYAASPAVGIAPATTSFQGRLYAVWKASGADNGLWYAAFDGSTWSAQARISGVASSAAPSVAVYDNKLYAAWKGQLDDQRLWYAAFDGTQWSKQAIIPGAVSNTGPALSAFAGRLHAVWSAGTGIGFVSASFDGAAWSNDAKPSSLHPFSPQAIADSGQSGAGGIDQGEHGDCVFEASTAAVAMTPRGRTAISQMITQHPDGGYVVAFPGEPQALIRVTQADVKTLRIRDKATWAAVLEGAVIKWNPNFANGAQVPPHAKGTPDGSAPTPAQYALHLLTGSPASKALASSPNIGDRIARALADGRPVVAHCANNDAGALVSGHEWTVMKCEPHTNRISVRNPWGRFGTAGTTKAGITYDGDAVATMTLQQFAQFYDEVTFGYDKA